MKLREAIICWTPNSSQYPTGRRGKLRVFGPDRHGPEHTAPFRCFAGLGDPRASAASDGTRERLVIGVWLLAVLRDGCDPIDADRELRLIDEYRDAAAEVPEADQFSGGFA